MMRRGHQAAPFGGGDALGRAAKTVRPALAHFDEDECRTHARDEVDFPEATAIIALCDDEALSAQK